MRVQKALLSVVIPFHDAAAFLPRTIDCLQKQTYKNFEAIFIDDGSSDGGGKLIQAVADPRFKLFRRRSCGGVGAARDLGLRKARGCYVTFVDADDAFDRRCFACMVEKICANDADLVRFNYLRESAPGSGKFVLVDDFLTLDADSVRVDGKNLVFEGDEIYRYMEKIIAGEIGGYLCWTIFRRELLADLSFREAAFREEDKVFTIEALKKARKIVFTKEAHYRYFMYGSSASHVKFSLAEYAKIVLSIGRCIETTVADLPCAERLIQANYNYMFLCLFWQISGLASTMSYHKFCTCLRKDLPWATLRKAHPHQSFFFKHHLRRQILATLVCCHCYGLFRLIIVSNLKLKGLPTDVRQ